MERGAVDERAARGDGGRGAGSSGGGVGGGGGVAGFVGRRRAAKRIRRKMIALHTVFSLVLAALLLPALGVVVRDLARESAGREALIALELGRGLASERGWDAVVSGGVGVSGVEFVVGDVQTVGADAVSVARAVASPGEVVLGVGDGGEPMALVSEGSGVLRGARVRSSAVREASVRMQVIVAAALFGVYGLIALALELFVLPRQVYEPIERLRRADAAVQAGDRSGELIPEHEMPRDELGEIMRSRNESVVKLRRRERELSAALARIETVAAELKEKNDLIETARRNLADQDRLASLGMMSAGIAHELNTPLAVLKGSVEKLARGSGAGDEGRLALMRRVIGRLERLSDSLLDFARLRPPLREPVGVRGVVSEAWSLVSLDRDTRRVVFTNAVAEGTVVLGDGDRLSQVFVNLLRNAVDAMGGRGLVRVGADEVERWGRAYLSVTVVDDGPGIAREVMDRLFEPFSSTNLDAHGTGLGLAVSEGIVREHGGAIRARNNGAPRRGATFEVLLPIGGGGGGDGPGGEAGWGGGGGGGEGCGLRLWV